MKTQKICNQKTGALNESERLEIARLLLKAGYTVRLGRKKPMGKPNGAYTYFIEYWEEMIGE